MHTRLTGPTKNWLVGVDLEVLIMLIVNRHRLVFITMRAVVKRLTIHCVSFLV